MTAQKKIDQRPRRELNKLQKMLDAGHKLKITWLPGHMRRVNEREMLGEVLGGEIRTAEYSPRATGAK